MQRLDKAQKANKSDDHKLPKKTSTTENLLFLFRLCSLPFDSWFISVSADISKDHLPAMKDF